MIYGRGFPLSRLAVIDGAIFASVTSEFLPTGLLPEVAADLGVSESRVGLLVTIFAGTVVATTAPLTVLTRNFSRKWLMVLLLAGFAATNILCAVAPNYEVLVVARVLGGLCHGLFWAVTGPYASHLVERRQLARALAVTNSGGTVAFVLGVPLGSALGHALGWRLAFAAMGGLVLVFVVLVVLFLPPVQHLVRPITGEIEIPARRDPSLPAVMLIGVTVLIAVTGQNAFYTYIAPWLIGAGGVGEDAVAPLLFAYGAAGVVGLVLAGLFGDRHPVSAQLVIFAGVAVTASILGAAAGTTPVVIVGLVLWGGLLQRGASAHARPDDAQGVRAHPGCRLGRADDGVQPGHRRWRPDRRRCARRLGPRGPAMDPGLVCAARRGRGRDRRSDARLAAPTTADAGGGVSRGRRSADAARSGAR